MMVYFGVVVNVIIIVGLYGCCGIIVSVVCFVIDVLLMLFVCLNWLSVMYVIFECNC